MSCTVSAYMYRTCSRIKTKEENENFRELLNKIATGKQYQSKHSKIKQSVYNNSCTLIKTIVTTLHTCNIVQNERMSSRVLQTVFIKVKQNLLCGSSREEPLFWPNETVLQNTKQRNWKKIKTNIDVVQWFITLSNWTPSISSCLMHSSKQRQSDNDAPCMGTWHRCRTKLGMAFDRIQLYHQ